MSKQIGDPDALRTFQEQVFMGSLKASRDQRHQPVP